MASNYCQVCEDLQENTEGTAPPRPSYTQPTCYDHMDLYREYKQKKELDHFVDQKKKELLGQNSKFTDFQMDPENLEEILKHFSSEQLHQFKEKVRNGSIDFEEFKKIKNKKEMSESKEPMNYISRSPIKCPVNSCGKTIGITSVLSHFLRDHQKHEHAVCYQEIIKERKATLEFSDKFFEFNRVTCLGVLVYAGEGQGNGDRPAELGICRQNSFLPEKYVNLVNHLPILIMGAKTSLSSLLDDSDMVESFANPEDEEIHIIVLWLATVETNKNIYCTITAYNKKGSDSRSTIVKVRNLKDSQNPQEFLSNESNYLMMNCGEIKILSENQESNMYMEVNIHEFD